jgi:SAM-dependent methyltransferase
VNYPTEPFSPRQGYDLASSSYEKWRWFKFWRLNEAPIVRRWLESLSPGLGLDAGSGTGGYLAEIAAARHRYVAVDLSSRMLSFQHEKARDFPGVLLGGAQADLAALPLPSARFDWVLSTRVLSHVPDIRAVFREFRRVLKTGGECLITDVHPQHPYTRVSIQTAAGDIEIETHKHSIADLRSSILETQDLVVLSLDEYRLSDLEWMPPREAFGKLFRNAYKPVFFVCRVIKR